MYETNLYALHASENRFPSQCPHLVGEWDYEKNGDLRPEEFTLYSTKKVWWKCPNCGMSWMARIKDRVKGSGCPYDSGRVPIPGKTDLATLRPDLATEWDYEKNGELRPENVKLHSHKKVWWKCPKCGMSWKATVDNRANGSGCPYDSGRVPIPGKTDLTTLRPDLAAEWDCEKNGELRPEHLTVYSNETVWWKCPKCKMSWKAKVYDRAYGSGCPYCAGHLPIPGKTDLATLRPDLASEWDCEKNGELRPENITLNTHKKVWWKCSQCGMLWAATANSRVCGNGCPYCSRHLPIPGKTDLATLQSDLAAEWDYEKNGELHPGEVTTYSNKKVWWRCANCGMSWEARVHSRVNGSGCPYDAGRIPIPNKTDLATLRPHLVTEWDYKKNGMLLPENVTLHSARRVSWKCSRCGGTWKTRVYVRANGSGCPYCHKTYHGGGERHI